ncbi:MAG: hypothetical protein Q9160_003080 [Pyrenula sp. 1 TL-2023]
MRVFAPARRLQFAPALFHTSPARAALSESDHDKDHPDREKHIDSHKHDSLNKQKDGKGEWKRELSSNSEQAIKADRGESHGTEEDIAKLQRETEQAAEASKKN